MKLLRMVLIVIALGAAPLRLVYDEVRLHRLDEDWTMHMKMRIGLDENWHDYTFVQHNKEFRLYIDGIAVLAGRR